MATGSTFGKNAETTLDKTSQLNQIPSGAVWKRVDLHLHSPGVGSFKCPDGADIKSEAGRKKLVEKYVAHLVSSGIELAAITDYNGVRSSWYGLIKEAAERQGITLFPGAEISFKVGKYGLHILAVFELHTNPDEINRFLLSLDRDPASPLFSEEERTHRDIELQKSLQDALRQLKDRFRCLLIIPHPDQQNGLCKTFQAEDAARLLVDVRPDALEHCPDSEVDRLISTGILSERFFQKLASVEFSDPKSIQEIGSKITNGLKRATFLKLSAANLGALKLALHDPETRLSKHSIPETRHARILSMEVQGSGFLGNLAIRWNDDLNSLIGGRGTGKSAILETLRYGLGLEPYSDTSYREALVRHALGSGGKVSLMVERPTGPNQGRRYRISRVWAHGPEVEELESGQVVTISPIEAFGSVCEPLVFGQREIQAVSADEAYRLRLLDDLIGEEAQEAEREVRKAHEAVEANNRAILGARQKLEKKAEFEQRLKSIEHEISIFEKEGVAEKLRTHTNLTADGKLLDRALTQTKEKQHAWQELGSEVSQPLRQLGQSLERGKSVHSEKLKTAAQQLIALSNELDDLISKGIQAFSKVLKHLDGLRSEWSDVLKPYEEGLRRLRQELQTDTLDPDKLLRLTAERSTLEPLLKELEQVERELEGLTQKRKMLLRDLQKKRHDGYVLRQKRCEEVGKLLQGRLRLSVQFKGEKEQYHQRLANLLKGSGVSKDAIQNIVDGTADGTGLAEAVRSGPKELEKRCGITPTMAQKVVDWLADHERRMLDLEVLVPSDTVQIELFVDGQPRGLDRLSVGQTATAILLLLFALEGRPLILDQPEDDLDNSFVYKDIVTLLREEKGLKETGRRRQILAATHNANIPVLGDAEQVITLEVEDRKCRILTRASIDDQSVREHIRNILEGGEEAFQRRAEKYGGID